MKKFIAVLLVVFACFSLSSEDIPLSWYTQITDVLKETSSFWTYYDWKVERIDEKTVKMSNHSTTIEENKRDLGETRSYTEEEEKVYEYYFRFNLSEEEKVEDRLLIMEKIGEIFSKSRLILSHSYNQLNTPYVIPVADSIESMGSIDINDETKKESFFSCVDFYYRLYSFDSLSHFVHYTYSHTTITYN